MIIEPDSLRSRPAPGRFASLFGAAILLCVILLGSSPARGADKGKSDKKNEPTKEICVTFDELPVAMAFREVDRTEVTERLLKALKKHEVKAAGFVVGNNIGESYDLLGSWLNNGHILGNLTYSNQDLQELSATAFINDIMTGEQVLRPMLAGFGQTTRYFRYPFLHYGKTVEAKREVGRMLATGEYVVAHASVLVEDYLYNLSLEKLRQPDSTEFDRLATEYIAHVLEELDRCERLAMEILKRPCRQILLLRANVLNSLTLDDLLTEIEAAGYRFVSLDAALKDELYSAPEAYFGSRGMGYLDMLLHSEPDLLPAE